MAGGDVRAVREHDVGGCVGYEVEGRGVTGEKVTGASAVQDGEVGWLYLESWVGIVRQGVGNRWFIYFSCYIV